MKFKKIILILVIFILAVINLNLIIDNVKLNKQNNYLSDCYKEYELIMDETEMYANYNNEYELIVNKNSSLEDEVRKLENRVNTLETEINGLNNKIYKLNNK